MLRTRRLEILVPRLVARRAARLAVVAVLLLASGCGQGEGDRCEIDDDCSGDLVCDINQGRQSGTCRVQGTIRPADAAVADRVNPDRTAADRAPDRAPPDALPDVANQPDGGSDSAAASDGAGDAGDAGADRSSNG